MAEGIGTGSGKKVEDIVVDAEQKRYELGTTTIFFVLAAQNDLTTAESVLVRESINYRRNLLQLSQRTGELLDERGISIQ